MSKKMPQSCDCAMSADKMSIRQMKAYLREAGVDMRGVVEKRELVELVNKHIINPVKHSDHSTKQTDGVSVNTTGGTSSKKEPEGKSQSATVHTIPVGPLQCNMTIVADQESKKAVLCDPGGDADKIMAVVEKMGVDIVQIVITHGHFDHILAAEEVSKRTKAPVFIHQDDLQLWNMLPMQLRLFGMQLQASTPPKPEGYLKHNDSLKVCGGRVIHTPGHTPGSLCFYFPRDQLLLSGDTLFRMSVGRTDLPGGNSRQLVTSIKERLYVLPDEVKVIPGHGPSTSIGFEKVRNMVVRADAKGSNSSK